MKIYLHLHLQYADRTLHLEGASTQPPVKGTFFKPGSGPLRQEDGQEVITEALRIACSGTRESILSLQDTLSELLSTLQRLQPEGLEALYLVVEYESGNAWQSRILRGWLLGCASGIAARESGADILTLNLERVNYWEMTTQSALLLTNRHGTLQPTLMIDNAADSTHDNSVDLAQDSAGGDLPAPLELILSNTHSGRSVGGVWIGQWDSTGCALPAWKPVYEGESASAGPGVTLTPTVDAGSSAGQFGRLAWSAGSEQRLASFLVSASHMSRFEGKYYKPLMRLANNSACTDLWLKAKLTYGTAHTCAYDSAWVLCAAGQPWLELEALRLPPCEPYGGFFEQMYISLCAMKTVPAAVSLDIDFLLLIPTDGYNRLHLLSPLEAGYQLREGEVLGSHRLNISSTYAWPSHSRQGSRLHIRPGTSTRFFFLHTSGSSWLVDTQLSVSLLYSPRKKVI